MYFVNNSTKNNIVNVNQPRNSYQLAGDTYLINTYCKNCIVIGSLVINKKFIHLLKNEPTNQIDYRKWKGKLLGYVTPGEMNQNIRISFKLNIPNNDDIRLWAYEAKKINVNQKRQIEKTISNIKKLLKDKIPMKYSIQLNDDVIGTNIRSY